MLTASRFSRNQSYTDTRPGVGYSTRVSRPRASYSYIAHLPKKSSMRTILPCSSRTNFNQYPQGEVKTLAICLMRVPPQRQTMSLLIFHLGEHKELIEAIDDAILSLQGQLLGILIPEESRVMKHRGRGRVHECRVKTIGPGCSQILKICPIR